MGTYSIADMERITGVKAHTIRIWEKRYKGLSPGRSKGNTRYYDDKQLIKLLNMMSLVEFGHKISKLFSLSDQEIKVLLEQGVNKTKSSDKDIEFFITQLLASGINYDESTFLNIITNCISTYGFIDTFMKIVFPMLIRLGLLWGKDNLCPSKEHFISNIVRQKLLVAIESLPPPSTNQKAWILLLPENEYHEIGLIFSNYVLRSYGCRTIFLGSNVPLISLENTLSMFPESRVMFFFTQNQSLQQMYRYLECIRTKDPKAKMILAGNPKWINAVPEQNDIIRVGNFEELEREIKSL
jgi:DNA-binding transcriptional MerR regulator